MGKQDNCGIGFLILMILLIIVLFLSSCTDSHRAESLGHEVMQYEYIVINGVEYKTDDIVDGENGFTWNEIYRANDEIYFYLKNGDKVTFQEGSYTLKNKKS